VWWKIKCILYVYNLDTIAIHFYTFFTPQISKCSWIHNVHILCDVHTISTLSTQITEQWDTTTIQSPTKMIMESSLLVCQCSHTMHIDNFLPSLFDEVKKADHCIYSLTVPIRIHHTNTCTHTGHTSHISLCRFAYYACPRIKPMMPQTNMHNIGKESMKKLLRSYTNSRPDASSLCSTFGLYFSLNDASNCSFVLKNSVTSKLRLLSWYDLYHCTQNLLSVKKYLFLFLVFIFSRLLSMKVHSWSAWISIKTISVGLFSDMIQNVSHIFML